MWLSGPLRRPADIFVPHTFHFLKVPVIDLAMNGYLRKIFFETHPSSSSQCSSYCCTSTASACPSKLDTWAQDINAVYGSSNRVFAPT